jgi:2,4-dienoyl-CoA reductase-like NADH-dependent reductase (Old Yellow Enzyme family)
LLRSCFIGLFIDTKEARMPTHLELLTPVSLGAMALKNRLVMAPLTRMRAIDGDVPITLAYN